MPIGVMSSLPVQFFDLQYSTLDIDEALRAWVDGLSLSSHGGSGSGGVAGGGVGGMQSSHMRTVSVDMNAAV